MKLYLDNVNFTTAKGRCSADGGHLYHYKSLAFDREPIRLLLESSGGYSCHQGFLLQLITVLVFDQQQHCFYRRAELLSKVYYHTDRTRDRAVHTLVA